MTEKTTEELSFAERLSALDAREATLNSREQTLADREKADRIAAEKARHEDNVSFAEGLVAATTLAPALKDRVIVLLDHLGGADVISFGEAGDIAPADALRDLLGAGKALLDLGERGKKGEGEETYTSFAAPAGYDVDPAAAAIYSRAVAIQTDNPDLDWPACVQRAQA